MGLKEKSKAVRRILIETGINPSHILGRYQGKNFVDGFSKFEVMKQVLIGDPSEQVVKYLTQRLSAPEYKFMRDRRPPFDYGCDLSLGWVLEDCLTRFLIRNGLGVRLVGCDSDREFLTQSEVRADADAEVTFGAELRNLEMVFDQSGYWSRNGKADLRASKFNNIQIHESLVLGVSVLDSKAFVYDPILPGILEVKYIKAHEPWGNKSAYSIRNIEEVIVPLVEISDAIKSVLSSRKREEVVA
jgi:hypothetical protein